MTDEYRKTEIDITTDPLPHHSCKHKETEKSTNKGSRFKLFNRVMLYECYVTNQPRQTDWQLRK